MVRPIRAYDTHLVLRRGFQFNLESRTGRHKPGAFDGILE